MSAPVIQCPGCLDWFYADEWAEEEATVVDGVTYCWFCAKARGATTRGNTWEQGG